MADRAEMGPGIFILFLLLLVFAVASVWMVLQGGNPAGLTDAFVPIFIFAVLIVLGYIAIGGGR